MIHASGSLGLALGTWRQKAHVCILARERVLYESTLQWLDPRLQYAPYYNLHTRHTHYYNTDADTCTLDYCTRFIS